MADTEDRLLIVTERTVVLLNVEVGLPGSGAPEGEARFGLLFA
jgi:hypothetical protein